MPPDFLNSREDAILLWALLLAGFVTYKGPRAIGLAVVGVLRAVFAPKLVLLFGSALIYSAVWVYAANEAALWHSSSLKPTVYWFIGTAIILVGDTVTRAWSSDPDIVRRVLQRVVGLTILIEVVVNLYTLPLAVEIVGVGIVLVFSMMQVVVQHGAAGDGRVAKLIEWVLGSVGLLYLGYVAIRGLGDLLDGAVSRERVEEFLVAPALTLALISFLYAVAWVSRRECERFQKRWRPRSSAPA
jgi:hypothetical protein